MIVIMRSPTGEEFGAMQRAEALLADANSNIESLRLQLATARERAHPQYDAVLKKNAMLRDRVEKLQMGYDAMVYQLGTLNFSISPAAYESLKNEVTVLRTQLKEMDVKYCNDVKTATAARVAAEATAEECINKLKKSKQHCEELQQRLRGALASQQWLEIQDLRNALDLEKAAETSLREAQERNKSLIEDAKKAAAARVAAASELRSAKEEFAEWHEIATKQLADIKNERDVALVRLRDVNTTAERYSTLCAGLRANVQTITAAHDSAQERADYWEQQHKQVYTSLVECSKKWSDTLNAVRTSNHALETTVEILRKKCEELAKQVQDAKSREAQKTQKAPKIGSCNDPKCIICRALFGDVGAGARPEDPKP